MAAIKGAADQIIIYGDEYYEAAAFFAFGVLHFALVWSL